MAAGSWTFYNDAKESLGNGTLDWNTDSWYCVLCTDSYTPSAAHSTESELTNEVVDADYDAQDITTPSVSETGGTVTFDCDDIVFGPSVTITAKYAVLIQGTVGAQTGTDKLLVYVDLNTGGSVSSTNDDFTVEIHTNGVWQW